MIDIELYIQKLDVLKEWMSLNIDRRMSNRVFIYETPNINARAKKCYFDIRNFETFYRHRKGEYGTKAKTDFWVLKNYFKPTIN